MVSEERCDGTVPTYRPFDPDAPRVVVCNDESPARIQAMQDAELRSFNEHLLAECEFAHLQAPVDAVDTAGTNIYVLPGQYREEPSWDPPCAEDHDGGVVDYPLIVSCGEVIILVTVAGDDPDDEDHRCDNALCDLQIEGTGERPEDVVFTGGFRPDGDRVKHNGLKADRADGVVRPAFPVPVGTGVLIAGGNLNLVRDNDLYDNWRAGAILFWVPGAVRGAYDPLAQMDTSNGNRFVENRLGQHPNGAVQPDGLDLWWDDEGTGNCWQDNAPATGEVTHDATLPTGLPDCDSCDPDPAASPVAAPQRLWLAAPGALGWCAWLPCHCSSRTVLRRPWSTGSEAHRGPTWSATSTTRTSTWMSGSATRGRSVSPSRAFDCPLMARSPMLWQCPDRPLGRSDDMRSQGAVRRDAP